MLAGTSPFDSDTDDDGIKDPEDPTPLHPGILTSDEQKLKDYNNPLPKAPTSPLIETTQF